MYIVLFLDELIPSLTKRSPPFEEGGEGVG